MNQPRFSGAEHHTKRKRTRREVFLEEINRSIPWDRLESIIELFYRKAGNSRRPYQLSTMLRIHYMLQWYCLSDQSMEQNLYEITSICQFAGLSLSYGTISDNFN